MTTVLVVYTNDANYSEELKKFEKFDKVVDKRYAFNVDGEVEEGDILETNTYDTNILVVKVLEENFKYFDSKSGTLSNTFNSTKMGEIKSIEIVDRFDTNIKAIKLTKKD